MRAAAMPVIRLAIAEACCGPKAAAKAWRRRCELAAALGVQEEGEMLSEKSQIRSGVCYLTHACRKCRHGMQQAGTCTAECTAIPTASLQLDRRCASTLYWIFIRASRPAHWLAETQPSPRLLRSCKPTTCTDRHVLLHSSRWVVRRRCRGWQGTHRRRRRRSPAASPLPPCIPGGRVGTPCQPASAAANSAAAGRRLGAAGRRAEL